MMQEVKNVFKKYAVFQGRAPAREYWFFVLFNFIVSMALSIISFALAAATESEEIATIMLVISGLYSLATFLPGFAVTVRRLHDTGKSGAYILMSLIPLAGLIIVIVKLAQASDIGTNRYGPCPEGSSSLTPEALPQVPQRNFQDDKTVFLDQLQPTREPQVQIKVICSAGALAGQSFSSGDSLCIGRSRSSCNIVFPENAKGISRTHCCLTINRGNAMLTDLGSSFGTYLENGTKLQPNVPVTIYDNTRFYLADRNTAFTVYIEIR